MKKLNLKRTAGLFAEGALLTTAAGHAALAVVPTSLSNGVASAQPNGAQSNLFGPGSLFQEIANTLLFLVGAIAVIMLIIGGLRYVISNGNASAVEGAKNTILFAIIGIVVAALAFAIVNFVIVKL